MTITCVILFFLLPCINKVLSWVGSGYHSLTLRFTVGVHKMKMADKEPNLLRFTVGAQKQTGEGG